MIEIKITGATPTEALTSLGVSGSPSPSRAEGGQFSQRLELLAPSRA